MSVFKLCGRPLRGYLLTPQTSALGMRDGVGNVPEPPAPRTVGIAGTRGQAVAAWHRARGRCRKDGRADRRRPRNSRRAFPSHDLSPPGTKRGPGGLKSETPLLLLDEALLSLPKFFSIKRSHRQRRVCAGPGFSPRHPPAPPLPTSASRNRLRAGSASRRARPAGANTWVLRGGRRLRRHAPSVSVVPCGSPWWPCLPVGFHTARPRAVHGVRVTSSEWESRRRSPRARLQRSPRHYWGSHSL